MRVFTLFAALFLISSARSRAISADDQAARDSALQWLGQIDAGHFAQAYHEMPPRIRTARGEELFVNWQKTRRAPLGHAHTRKIYKVTRTQKLEGAPDGNYQKMAFKTSFDRKKDAFEMLILTSETGKWEVSGYKIY
jgi:hypothetical protein